MPLSAAHTRRHSIVKGVTGELHHGLLGCLSGMRPVGRYRTRYGLDGPRIESRWGGRDFPHPARPAHPASYTMGTGSFPGVKRPVREVNHPPPSSAEFKERVELCLYSPSGPSWPVLG
jgi:hypothetical protein